MNPGQIPSGTKFPQAMVSQIPKFDNKIVYSRKMKIHRPTKRRKKERFL